jgi:glycosyltransferase involved in cell wall biosynthesis
MNTPLVSVIIPSYNYGRFVAEAVESALAQTYRPIEVIVVDDGSKDNTSEVMQAYASNPLVQYIRQENKGLPGARNTGIRAAQGEYIALLDADDVWAPEKIARQVAFYEQHQNAALVATATYVFGHVVPQASPSLGADSENGFDEYCVRDLMEFRPFGPSSVMLSRAKWQQVGGFDEQLRYVEDLDMWVRLAAHGRMFRLAHQLTGFRSHPAAQSMHMAPHLRYHKLVLDKLFTTVPELQAHPHWRRLAEARTYIHLSWMRYHIGDRVGALSDVGRSIACWPFALCALDHHKERLKRLKLMARYALKRPSAT